MYNHYPDLLLIASRHVFGVSIYIAIFIYLVIKDFYYVTVRIYVIQKFDKNSSDILVS